MMATEPGFVYVEDDPVSRTIMQTLLCRIMKYKDVAIFENSADFMGQVERLPFIPGVFFLDIHVEPDDGFSLLNMVRAHDQYADTMIIAVTASVMNEEVEELHAAGFDGGIAKPIDQLEFPGLVHHILNRDKVWFIK
jgi:CheY-like chemotaxis protein